ncbi:MAG: hypothetical protein QMD01_02070, partial [Thermodesulfovibrionales bacterium]|nr:hypothetical protein [Thermodesulfovibrionales bacterium]
MATFLFSIIMIVLGKNLLPVFGIGLLSLFLIYALWNPPKKHKDYSLSDQQQATSRALGGGGTTDLLDIKPTEEK